jgi:phosphoglycolate phosphatase-like HAD superfamily hydrolase
MRRIAVPLPLLLLALAIGAASLAAQEDPLLSWRVGPVKTQVVDFVRRVTTAGSTDFVAPGERIATFDNDGTLWAEQPMYVQLAFAVDRVKALAPQHPEWKATQPFKAVLEGNLHQVAASGERGAVQLLGATHAGMTNDEFAAIVRDWLTHARHPRFQRPYTELVYQPMLEVLRYLRDNAFKTYIVTGGGQDFVRVYAEKVYGIPSEQVIGTAGGTKYGYGRDGGPFLTKEPKLLLNDNNAGKPEGIHLMIGRRPYAAFGNSTGDRQMLEWTGAGAGARLKMLVLHDDATREYAYGPARGLPDSKVGTFTPALYDEATK